jgi:cation/acetate symporter
VTRPIAEYLWFSMNPISAGVFGLPASMITIIIVSLLTAEPSRDVQELVEHVRYQHLRGDFDTQAA